MAVLAINFVLPCVQLVRKWNGLFGLVALLYTDYIKAINHIFGGQCNYQKSNQANHRWTFQQSHEIKLFIDDFPVFFCEFFLFIDVSLNETNHDRQNHQNQQKHHDQPNQNDVHQL